MENRSATKVYLDMNVYDSLCRNHSSADVLKREGLVYYISVAHAEELYRMKKNDVDNKYADKIGRFECLVNDSLNGGVIKPSLDCVFEIEKNLDPAMGRVKEIDTVESIEERSTAQFKKTSEDLKCIREDDKNTMYYSTLSSEDIWSAEKVSELLDNSENERIKFNLMRPVNVEKLINAGYTRAQAEFVIRPIEIPLKKGGYPEIRESYCELEYHIAFLFDILQQCGYCNNKDIRTAVSGEYDIQHAICSTYCDILVTNDKRFLHRASAVYYYLDIPTKVMSFDDFKNLYLI